jgi:flagellar FliJ protein
MKAYKFRFESVLKSKRIIVDQLASKTARARKIRMLEQLKLDDLKARQTQCIGHLAAMQTGPIDAAEVRRGHDYLRALGEAIEEQKNMVAEIARRVEMLLSMLTEAEKERKIFDRLEEKEREEFTREFLKKEQAEFDEIGVNRFIQREAYERFHPSAG